MFLRLLFWVWIVILLGVINGCMSSAYEHQLETIIGISEPEYAITAIAEDVSGFGEGFVIEKFHLTENTSSKFENHITAISPKAGWKSQGWISTKLISKADSKAIEMVIKYSTRNRELNELVEEIKQSIERERSYFACYCKPDCENPIKSVVFVYDFSTCNLWVVEAFF